jgi:hypothetical protein
MNEVMRDRIWRKLQVLPDAQLYQVLDYIEFLETKYAREQARKPDSIQRFAEKLEDSMRMRSVAPKVISGTVGAIGTARKMMRSVTDVGRDLIDGVGDAARSATTDDRNGSRSGAAAAPPERQLPPGNSLPRTSRSGGQPDER